MAISAKLYIGLAIVAGVTVLAYSVVSLSVVQPAPFAFLLVLALLGGGLKLRLPRMRGTLSLSFLPILLSTELLSLPETILMTAGAAAVQTVLRSQRKPLLVQTAFNMSAVVLSITLAVWASAWIAGSWSQQARLVSMAAAACIYYLSNTLLVSGVICLVEHKPLAALWSNCYFWTLPYYLIGGSLILFAAETAIRTDWPPSLLILSIMLLVYRYYKMWIERSGIS